MTTPEASSIEMIAKVVQSLLTSAALIIGGAWTYFLFIKNRLKLPSASISIRSSSVLLTSSSRLIEVYCEVANRGKVLLQPLQGEVRLRQVVPPPDKLLPNLSSGLDPLPEGESAILWPVIAQRHWAWQKGDFKVEPGENEDLVADFAISENVQVVQVYVLIQNPQNPDGPGWTHSQIIELGGSMSNNQNSNGNQRDKQQQQREERQQKPQQSQQSTQQSGSQSETPNNSGKSSGSGN